MTGSKHNHEGNSSDKGEPGPGPYWTRMHRDWRFWVGAILMAAALAVYVMRATWHGYHMGTGFRKQTQANLPGRCWHRSGAKSQSYDPGGNQWARQLCIR